MLVFMNTLSGWSKDILEAEIMRLYNEKNGENFKFIRCVPVLFKIPAYSFEFEENNSAEKFIGNVGGVIDEGY